MSARLPGWSELEVFLQTARAGTLTSAAEALGVNASTVQRRVGRLEADLGTRLFDRTPRGHGLTTAGEELYRHVLAMEGEAIAAARRLSGRDASLEGTVRVATVDDLAVRVLPPVVRAFQAAHPKVSVELSIGTDFADLERKQADLAVRFGARPKRGDLVVRHVSRVDAALYASDDYLDRRGAPRDLGDLEGHAIVRGDAMLAELPMERIMDRHAPPSAVVFRSHSMLARLAAIRAGIGLGFLGAFMGEGEPGLRRLAFDFPEAASDLWIVVHVDLRRSARVRAFVEHVQCALGAIASTFAPWGNS